MKPRDPFDAKAPNADPLDRKILQALREEGVIIPETVQEVRRAKARLQARPVTVPPHLRDSSAIFDKAETDDAVENTKLACDQHAIGGRKIEIPTPSHRATDEFVEAIVIAQLVREMADSEHPLGRKRYNKLAYLAHRKTEDDVSEHYLKKAAGPYSPWAKYGGPERIAVKNGYVKSAKAGFLEGLVCGQNIDKIDQYLARYPICAAIDWVVSKLRFKKNDELELLATVDFASLDLLRENTPVTPQAVKNIIATNSEWAPKLERETFSDENIASALSELRDLFPATYARCS
jgi:hypothetical protein